MESQISRKIVPNYCSSDCEVPSAECCSCASDSEAQTQTGQKATRSNDSREKILAGHKYKLAPEHSGHCAMDWIPVDGTVGEEEAGQRRPGGQIS